MRSDELSMICCRHAAKRTLTESETNLHVVSQRIGDRRSSTGPPGLPHSLCAPNGSLIVRMISKDGI